MLWRDNASVYTAMMTNVRNLLFRNWVSVLIITHKPIFPRMVSTRACFVSKFEIENESLPIWHDCR